MTAIQPPYALQGGTINHPAKLFRRVLEAVFDEGVADLNGENDLKVSQQSSPGMSVKVAKGMVFVRGTSTADQGLYGALNDGDVNVTINAAPGSPNSRIDLITARVKDNFEDSGGADTWLVDYVAGTAGNPPSAPALPASSYKLATIAVGTSVTQILDANITDNRNPIPFTRRIPLHGVLVYRIANQNLTDAAQTAIQFNNEEYDTDGYHDNVTLNTEFVVPTNALAGYYFIQATGTTDGSSDTGVRILKIRKNGATDLAENRDLNHGASGQAYARTISAGPVLLVKNDYIEFTMQQSSGGSLAAVGTRARLNFSMWKVGEA
jgi:hypothetical protein